MNTQEKIESYVKLRDHKDAANKEFKKSMERINAAMQKLENDLMADLKASGGKSLACDSGTVYINTKATASVKDRKAFLKFVFQTKNLELLDARANKTIVRELNQRGTTVPGVTYTEVKLVGVRRGKDHE